MKAMDFLFKYFKKIIPNRLVPRSILTRFTLIICIPMLLCQLLAVYIFYKRHWYNVSTENGRVISSKIKLIYEEFLDGDLARVIKFSKLFDFSIDLLSKMEDRQNKQGKKIEMRILKKVLSQEIPEIAYISRNPDEGKINIYLYLDINKIKQNKFTNLNSKNYLSNLKENFGNSLSITSSENIIDFITSGHLLNKSNYKIMKITMPQKPLVNPVSEIFVYWIIGISLIFLLIAMIFARNQIRSIEELSEAANKFGKGDLDELRFKPAGALEIRNAGFALLKMQKRLKHQLKKKLQMLAIISHDLRTPLTRMLLQIELMDDSNENNKLKSDLESMKHMIDSYLDFARSESSEKFVNIELKNWVKEFESKFRPKSVKFIYPEEKINVSIKPISFSRALMNIITNAEKYSDYAELTFYQITEKHKISSDSNKMINDEKNISYVIFELDDNGQGIDETERDLVFQAFYRSDKARSIDEYGSVGLGLSIAQEIILSHKGNILIKDSQKLGGTKISFKIPKQKKYLI